MGVLEFINMMRAELGGITRTGFWVFPHACNTRILDPIEWYDHWYKTFTDPDMSQRLVSAIAIRDGAWIADLSERDARYLLEELDVSPATRYVAENHDTYGVAILCDLLSANRSRVIFQVLRNIKCFGYIDGLDNQKTLHFFEYLDLYCDDLIDDFGPRHCWDGDLVVAHNKILSFLATQ